MDCHNGSGKKICSLSMLRCEMLQNIRTVVGYDMQNKLSLRMILQNPMVATEYARVNSDSVWIGKLIFRCKYYFFGDYSSYNETIETMSALIVYVRRIDDISKLDTFTSCVNSFVLSSGSSLHKKSKITLHKTIK